MKYYLATLLILSIVVYLRASFQAQGKIRNKLFAGDSFLLGQQITAVLLMAAAVLAVVVKESIFAYAAIANLILDFLFYLQPTPRTTKKILWIFILVNAVFVLLLLV